MMEYFDSELVKKLTVSIGDAAKITGVPIRKIRYWEEKGYIESVNKEEKKIKNIITLQSKELF